MSSVPAAVDALTRGTCSECGREDALFHDVCGGCMALKCKTPEEMIAAVSQVAVEGAGMPPGAADLLGLLIVLKPPKPGYSKYREELIRSRAEWQRRN